MFIIIVSGVFNYRPIMLKLTIPAGIALLFIVIVGLPLLIITARNVSILIVLEDRKETDTIALYF
jgi:hypothetical protein